ncbi:hypothetical protein DWV13_16450 [Clostridium botulinum]|uniref:phage lytic cycle repressor MrpR family protein n=1 Tax=Clostridium TaxID=1485 RepID=UPI0013FCBB62|nr:MULTISPECIES: hypothetical protein [Clostridium]MCS6133184.1 hypothetical protein [Clostridium botulinum]NFL46264.1 hypothetical protein [Clostridium botulinum]NFL90299.1 hypothetical protein [Clostridium botulinum]
MPNLRIQDLEFIGENYIVDNNLEKTEQKKQDILSTYDKFQHRKINFLNELYDKYNTKHSYFNMYNNNMHNFEQVFNKDLMYFSPIEIINIISGFTFMSESMKRSLLSFCTQYCEYWVGKGKININPCEGISFNESIKNSTKLLKSKIYEKEYVLKVVDSIIEKGNPNHAKPLLLARIGILGEKAEYMRNLKWRDIDVLNNIITISNEDSTSRKNVKVDKCMIDKLISIQSLRKSDKEMEYISIEPNRYVLEARNGGALNYNTLNGWIRAGCESAHITRIPPKDLIFSRQMEQLLRRRKHKRLTTDDMMEVANETEFENVKITRGVVLKQRYEELTGDKVFRGLKYNKMDGDKVIELRTIEVTGGDVEGEYKNIMESLEFKEY